MIEFEGRTYYLDKTTGYYKTLMRHSNREYLHRAIYQSTYGNIPQGWHVHHKNEDKDDNRLENLECIPLKEHNQRHREQLVANGHQTKHVLRIKHQFTCERCGCIYEA